MWKIISEVITMSYQPGFDKLFASTDFCAGKIFLHARSCMKNYVSIKQSHLFTLFNLQSAN